MCGEGCITDGTMECTRLSSRFDDTITCYEVTCHPKIDEEQFLLAVHLQSNAEISRFHISSEDVYLSSLLVGISKCFKC